MGVKLYSHKKTGVNEVFVSRVVTGRQKLTPEEQKMWVDALECKPEDIF